MLQQIKKQIERDTNFELKNSLSNLDSHYIKAATRPNTRKAYQADVRHFMKWGGLLPATPTMVIKYLTDNAQSLNPRTLSRRLTAIRQWHVYQNYLNPTEHP